jgi:tight adherence protein B
MNILIVGIVMFVISAVVIHLILYAYRNIKNPDRAKIQKRLKTFSPSGYEVQGLDILDKKVMSDLPILNQILLGIPGMPRLSRLIMQANSKQTLGFFMLLSLVLALSGFLGSHYVIRNHITSIIIAAILGVIPLLHLFLKKKKRMEKFERQLPEGLELIARALRAGHAFTTGMKLAADEFDDPLGPEFDETLEEINLGVSVHDALKSLTYRIDCPDLKYFVVSVILQRETGGNLAEIMESIARIIRERFKLHGKIRILAAEGKLSAAVLLGLPFVVVIALKFINPEYIETLFSEDIGIIMVAISSFMMFIGILVMRKIIRIKV